MDRPMLMGAETCGECPNQAFIPVTYQEIAKHLRGAQVMDVYPILPDETCWFLAADFDEKTWQEDVTAFVETCDKHGVPVAIERSRSGNGAHAWFFFASPVSALAARKTSTLVLVHRRPLLDQWIAQLAVFLGIEPKNIGQIGAGKSKPNGRLDVAMVQSLVHKGAVADLVVGYGQVIQDEVHHAPCVSFERVVAEVKAKYLLGLTATPQRRDGHHPILHMQLGPVRFAVDAKSQAARRPFDHKLLVRETGFLPAGLPDSAGIKEIYAAVTGIASKPVPNRFDPIMAHYGIGAP